MGTHFKGSAKEINTLNSYIKLVRAYETLSSRMYMLFEKYGLTESQFYILDVLYHLEAINQKILAQKICRSEGNITMVVNNLLKSKLIKKSKDSDDQRIFIINLTDDGRELYQEVFNDFLKSLMIEFKNINKKEHKEFQKICKILGSKNNLRSINW